MLICEGPKRISIKFFKKKILNLFFKLFKKFFKEWKQRFKHSLDGLLNKNQYFILISFISNFAKCSHNT